MRKGIIEGSNYEHPFDTFPLRGKILGTPGCRDDDGLHEYTNELFYWDKGQWLSAGQQTALSDSLVYSVPKMHYYI